MNEKLEIWTLRKKEVTVAKLDIVAMYPSIQFLGGYKSVGHILKKFPREEKQKTNKCLKLVEFYMAKTLVALFNKYYKYGGDIYREK